MFPTSTYHLQYRCSAQKILGGNKIAFIINSCLTRSKKCQGQHVRESTASMKNCCKNCLVCLTEWQKSCLALERCREPCCPGGHFVFNNCFFNHVLYLGIALFDVLPEEYLMTMRGAKDRALLIDGGLMVVYVKWCSNGP